MPKTENEHSCVMNMQYDLQVSFYNGPAPQIISVICQSLKIEGILVFKAS